MYFDKIVHHNEQNLKTFRFVHCIQQNFTIFAQKAGACGIMVAMVLLSTFVFIPKGSVARIIVPIVGAIGVLTVIFAVPNAKDEE